MSSVAPSPIGASALGPPAPPPPATRSLSVVLTEALASGEEVRLIVAKALADTSQNANAYLNVEIEGLQLTIPKVAGAGLGGTGSGYPVYVLATKDFMLAVGTVIGTAVGPGGLTLSSLTVTGNTTTGSLNVGGQSTLAGLQLNGYGNVTGSFDIGGNVTVGGGNGLTVTFDIRCRDIFPRGVGASGDVNASGWVQGGGVRQVNDTIRIENGRCGFFGHATVTQPRADFTSDGNVLSQRLWTALRDLGLIQNV